MAGPCLTPEQRVVVGRIQALMEFWHIDPDELDRADPPAPPTAQPETAEPAGPAKYRHPRHGASWDGRGPQPAWLREALLREGYRVEELRSDGSDPASTPAADGG